MNAGKVENSPGLKAVLGILELRGPAGVTTWQFIEEAHVANPATEVSALRHNGYQIDCKYEGKRNGRKVYRYTLIPGRLVQSDMFGEGQEGHGV